MMHIGDAHGCTQAGASVESHAMGVAKLPGIFVQCTLRGSKLQNPLGFDLLVVSTAPFCHGLSLTWVPPLLDLDVAGTAASSSARRKPPKSRLPDFSIAPEGAGATACTAGACCQANMSEHCHLTAVWG